LRHASSFAGSQIFSDAGGGCGVCRKRPFRRRQGGRPFPCGDALIAKMSWLNPPQAWHTDRGRVFVHPHPKTDFWRKTFTETVSDNAAFFHLTASGEFAFDAKVSGAYGKQFDQAGVMIRIDEQTWMKCGTEMFEGRRKASVVLTREYSDWSTMPDLSDDGPVWWHAVRHRDSLEIYASATGKDFTLVRSASFPQTATTEAGIFCCAPGDASFDATFDELKLATSKNLVF
jgi:uncharacterized protein